MSEKGKIIIRKSKEGKLIYEVDIGKKKPMLIPDFYHIDNSLNGKECKVEREKGQIKHIFINGKELGIAINKPKIKESSKKSYGSRGYNPKNPHQKNRYQPEDSFDIQKTKLPSDTREVLKNLKDIDNFNLKLNKAARFENEKFEFFKTDKGKVKYQIKMNFSKDLIDNISKRYYESIKKLNLKVLSELISKPDWRMVIGLGNESVYETSMTLHYIYGIPYIPGSAIKGVVRSYIITEKFGKNGKGEMILKNAGEQASAEERALKDPGFCNIFGCPEKSFYNESRQGKIIFFDAFPLSEPQIKVDVMNPHYGPYYSDSSGKVPPADYHNPVPIFFLTVEDTEFKFIIGVKEKDNDALQQGILSGKSPLDMANEWMKRALEEHGIGAKTSVGYGYFAL